MSWFSILAFLAVFRSIGADTLVASGHFSTVGPFVTPSIAKFNGWFWDTAFTKTPLDRGSVVSAGCKSGSVYVFGGNISTNEGRQLHFMRTSTWYFAGFDDAFFVPPSTLRPTTYGRVFNGDGEKEAGLFDGEELDFGEFEFGGDGEAGGEDEPVEPVEPVEGVEGRSLRSTRPSGNLAVPPWGLAQMKATRRHERLLGSMYAQYVADLTGAPGSVFCVGGSVLVAGPFSNATADTHLADDDAIPLSAFPSDDDSHVSGDVGAVGVWSPAEHGFVLLGEPGQVQGVAHAVVGPDTHRVFAGGFFDGELTHEGITTTIPTSQNGRFFSLNSLAQWTHSDGWRTMQGGAMLPGDNGTLGSQGEVFAMALWNETGTVYVGGHAAMCNYEAEELPTTYGAKRVDVPEMCFSYVAIWDGTRWQGDTDFGAGLNGAVTAVRYEQSADVLHVGGLFSWCSSAGSSPCVASSVSMAMLGELWDVQWTIPSPSDIVPCGFVSSVARLSNHTAVGGALKLVSAVRCTRFMTSIQAQMNTTRGQNKEKWTEWASGQLDSHFPGDDFCGVAWAATEADKFTGAWGCAGATDGPVLAMYAYPDVGPKGFTVALIVCLATLGAVLGCGALCWGAGTVYYMLCKIKAAKRRTAKKQTPTNKPKATAGQAASKPSTAGSSTAGAAASGGSTSAKSAAASSTGAVKAGANPSTGATGKQAKNASSTATPQSKMAEYIKAQRVAWSGFHQECVQLAKWWALAALASSVFDLGVVLPVSVALGAGKLDGVASLFTKRQWVPELYVDVTIGASLALPSVIFVVVMIAAHAARMYPDPKPTAWLQTRIKSAATLPVCGPVKRWPLKNDTPTSPAQLSIMHSVFASRIAPTVTIVLVTSVWAALFTAAAFLAPMPLTVVQLSPTWGSIAYSLALVAVAQLCNTLITYFHAPVMPAQSTLVLRLVLRGCLSLAQSSLIALNPSAKIGSLLTPLFSAAADYILLGGLVIMYERFPSQQHLEDAPTGAKIGLMSKLAMVVGLDANNPIGTWNTAAEGRLVRLCGFIIDFFLLGGYTLVFSLQLAALFALDILAFQRISLSCTNPVLRRHQLDTNTVPRILNSRANGATGNRSSSVEAQLPLLSNASTGAALPPGAAQQQTESPASGQVSGSGSLQQQASQEDSSSAANLPGSCSVLTAASHSALFGKDVRALHVCCALLALSLSGFASPGSFVSVGGQAWVPPATAAVALTLLGVRQAVSTFFDTPPKLLGNGVIVVVLFFLCSWAVLDGFALTVGFAHSFSITAAAPLIAFTVVFHGTLLVVVLSLWCCTPKKSVPLTQRRIVRCCGVPFVDPQHAMFRYTRSRKPVFSCLRSK